MKSRALGVGRRSLVIYLGEGRGLGKETGGFTRRKSLFPNFFPGVRLDRTGAANPSPAHLGRPPPGTRFVWRSFKSLLLAERPTMKQIFIL